MKIIALMTLLLLAGCAGDGPTQLPGDAGGDHVTQLPADKRWYPGLVADLYLAACEAVGGTPVSWGAFLEDHPNDASFGDWDVCPDVDWLERWGYPRPNPEPT